MASSVRYSVNERQVSYFISPQGEVGQELTKIAKNGYLIARSEAPVRSGRLQAGIFYNGTRKSGPWTGSSVFGGSARHTAWVNDGTSRIFPHGDFLVIPGRRSGFITDRAGSGGSKAYKTWVGGGKSGKRGFFFADSVAGQDGQHFLEEALRRAMTTFRLGG